MLSFVLSVIGTAIVYFVLYGFCVVTVVPIMIATLITLIDAVNAIDDWTSIKSVFGEIGFAFMHYWKDDLIDIYRELRRSDIEILALGCVICAVLSTMFKPDRSSYNTTQTLPKQVVQQTVTISEINPAIREGIEHIIDVINNTNALPRWKEVSEIEISRLIAEGKITEDEGNVMRISIKMFIAVVEPIIEAEAKTNDIDSTSMQKAEINVK